MLELAGLSDLETLLQSCGHLDAIISPTPLWNDSVVPLHVLSDREGNILLFLCISSGIRVMQILLSHLH